MDRCVPHIELHYWADDFQPRPGNSSLNTVSCISIQPTKRRYAVDPMSAASCVARFQIAQAVIAADQQGQALPLAYGTTDSPLGTEIVAWRSANQGNSWELPSHLTNVTKSGQIEFDPWMESDRRGNFYSVHVHAGPSRSLCEALLRKSHDGGRTWTEGRPLPWKGADRPVLGISPAHYAEPPRAGTDVIATLTSKLAKSLNHQDHDGKVMRLMVKEGKKLAAADCAHIGKLTSLEQVGVNDAPLTAGWVIESVITMENTFRTE